MSLSPRLCPLCGTRFLYAVPLVLSLKTQIHADRLWRPRSCKLLPHPMVHQDQLSKLQCFWLLAVSRPLAFLFPPTSPFSVKLRHLLLPQAFPTLSEGC